MDEIIQQRQAVTDEAQAWLHTPYHSGARIKGIGCDCAQFPAAVYGELSLIDAPPLVDYPPDWHLHQSEERYLAEVVRHAVEIPGPPQPGDFVIWRVGRCFAHGAIVIAWPTVVHAVRRLGVVLGDAERDCLGPGYRLADRPVKYFTLARWAV